MPTKCSYQVANRGVGYTGRGGPGGQIEEADGAGGVEDFGQDPAGASGLNEARWPSGQVGYAHHFGERG